MYSFLKKYSRLKMEKKIYCRYTPERINPGDKKHTFKNFKVVSGDTKLQEE